MMRRLNKDRKNYDIRHRVKALPELDHGTEVWITNSSKGAKGNITTKTNTPRSYIINTPGGTVRRRQHLIAVPKASTHSSENNPRDGENHTDDEDTPKIRGSKRQHAENNFQNQ